MTRSTDCVHTAPTCWLTKNAAGAATCEPCRPIAACCSAGTCWALPGGRPGGACGCLSAHASDAPCTPPWTFQCRFGAGAFATAPQSSLQWAHVRQHPGCRPCAFWRQTARPQPVRLGRLTQRTRLATAHRLQRRRRRRVT